MITRRLLTGLSIASVLLILNPVKSPAQTTSSFDPPGIIHSIYTRVAAGDGESGGNFVIQGKAARAKYLSKSLIALWAKSDARTPDGDVGAIDFDPVTNSQAPSVKSFTVTPEKARQRDRNDRRQNDREVMRSRTQILPTPWCVTISYAMADTGRLTTFAARTTASLGQSAPC